MTTFGSLVRAERRDRRWLLGDLAKKLDISTPYMSLIETDQRAIPDHIVDGIVRVFDLNGEAERTFRRAAALSRTDYAINVGDDAPAEDRTLASELALSFARLTPQAKAKLWDLLKEDRRG